MAPRGKRTSQGADFRTVNPAPLMLLRGPEDYLAIRTVDRIKATLRQEHPLLEYTRLNVAEAQRGELLTLTSPSLFGEPRMIVAEDLAAMNEAFLEDALSYVAQGGEPDVTVIMRHTGGNRGKKLVDAVAAHGVVVDCAAVSQDSAKLDFVRQEFKVAGRVIHVDAARALVAAAGSSLSDLGSAAGQLMRDVAGEITIDHVDKYFGGRVEASAFKVADAAFDGQSEAAARLFRHAMATGVSPVAVTAALARKSRQIAALVDLRGRPEAVASTLGVPPWQLQQAAQTARRWGPVQAAAAVEVIAQADADVKGASRAPEYAVEKALAAIAARVGG